MNGQTQGPESGFTQLSPHSQDMRSPRLFTQGPLPVFNLCLKADSPGASCPTLLLPEKAEDPGLQSGVRASGLQLFIRKAALPPWPPGLCFAWTDGCLSSPPLRDGVSWPHS